MWFVQILWVWIACGFVGGIFNVRCNCTLTQQQYEHLKRVSKLTFGEKSLAAVGIWTRISSAPNLALKRLSHIHEFSTVDYKIKVSFYVRILKKIIKNLLSSSNFFSWFCAAVSRFVIIFMLCVFAFSKTRSGSARTPTSSTCGHARPLPQSRSSVPNSWKKNSGCLDTTPCSVSV